MQTLNISKLYINNFNNNSKCNSLQDNKKYLIIALSVERTSVSKTNKCTPTQYWHDSWKFHIQYMENVWVFFTPSPFRKNKIGLFYCVELTFSSTISDHEGHDKSIKRTDMKHIKVTCESRSLAFCLMSPLVELPETVDTVCFSLLTISPCVFYYIYKSSEEAEFCTLGNARYTE